MDEGRRETVGLALGFVGVVAFGVTLPVTQLALRSFDAATVTVGRAVLAGVAAVLLLVVLRRPPPWRHLRRFAVIAVAVTVGFPGFMALAMRTVPAGHGGVVLGILPLATGIAAAFVAGERPSRRYWAFAVVGAAIVTAFTLRHGVGGLEAGDLYLVLAGASAAIGYAHSGRLAREMPGWEVISWVLVLSLPAMAAALAWLWPSIPWDAPARDWWALVYLGLVSQFAGFFFWNAGLAMGGVARVGQVQLLQTFVTLAVSAVLLGEAVDAVTVATAVAVAGVVWFGRKAPVARRPGS